MNFKPGDVIHAEVTKANRLQEAGLKLEKRRNGRIYVQKVAGLFKLRNVPVRVGDELLKINGKEMSEFAHLDHIKLLMKQEMKIQILFARTDPDEVQEEEDEPVAEEPREEYPALTNGEEYPRLEYQPYDIEPGDVMILQGLTGPRQNLNGEQVVVIQESDTKPGRWEVEVERTGAVIYVMADKLAPAYEDEEVIEEEEEQEEILRLENGPAYDDYEDDSGIRPGMQMKLFKLKKKAKMNGTVVEVVGKADRPGRWEVQIVNTGQILSIADENLKPL